MNILKVSTKSSPNAVAGAIAGILRAHNETCIQVIGAGALNQAVKAIAIARTFLVQDGIDPICFPSFYELEIEGERRTAIRLTIENRASRPMNANPVAPGEELLMHRLADRFNASLSR